MYRKESQKGTVLKKYSQPYLSTTFSLALAAVVAVSAAGCAGNAGKDSGNTAAPSAASAAATITAHIPSGSSADQVGGTIGASIMEDTAGTAATASADAAGSLPDTAENIKDETAASSVTAGSAATPPDSVESGNETASMGITADKTAGIGGSGASLKESDLMEALTECTGWGSSAGSSLRAATAAVLLLQWANDTSAGTVDTALLTSTIREKTGELSDTQLQDLKDNWSAISFDADQILNHPDEIRVLTEDAGCAEAAKDAASHKDAAANWKAVSQAFDNILK